MNRCERRPDKGFTLIEILVAIVVVGILSAVAVIGISSLTAKSGSAACATSRDAAIAGSTVHYTNSGSFPTKLSDMTGAAPSELNLPASVTLDATGTIATGNGWTLTLTPGASGAAPTVACGSTSSASAGGPNGTTACPGTFTGWVGEYYSTVNLTGSATLCRDDASINFDWASGSPGGSVPVDNFSSRWTKTVSFTAGTHVFTVGSDDGSRLYIDGVKVLDMWVDQGYTTRNVSQSLTAGNHVVVMEFYERGGLAHATLAWT